MNVTHAIDEIRSLVRQTRCSGKTIGLMPTLGAMHDGHASLIEAARAGCDFVVVSIFVNPTQFGPGEDFAKYPRLPEQDLAMCRRLGVDAVFMPSANEMYPGEPLTQVSVPELSGVLCGASRPGHFDGVCLVVAKLFNVVQPDRAYFGAKDYQQAAIVRRMTADLSFGTEIVICPTVREADGLAMSSRNIYLSAAERAQAPALYQALCFGRDMILKRRPPAGEVMEAMRRHIAEAAPLGEIDYLEIVDPQALAAVVNTNPPVLIALAVKFGKARLIDNMLVESTA